MALDPTISLGVKPYESVSRIDQYKGLVSLQSLMSENRLRQQQIQTSQQNAANLAAEAKQRVLDQQDQNQLENYWHDPNFQKAYGSGDTESLSSMLGGKLQSKTIQNVISSATTQATAHNALGERQRENREKFAGQVGNIVNAINSTEDDEQAAEIGRQGLMGLHSDPDFSTLGVNLPDPQTLTPANIRDKAKNAGAFYNITQATIDKAQSLRKAQADLEKTKADTANTQAEQAIREAQLPGVQADSGVKVEEAPTKISLTRYIRNNPKLLSPEEQEKADEAAKELGVKTSELGVSQGRLAVEQKRANIEAQKFSMEYGGDAVKGWAKNVLINPDTAGLVPSALRTGVEKELQNQGYSFPKPADATSRTTENAANNAIANAGNIRRAIQNPEVAQRIGPILGRLGNAEQDAGSTVGLSPEAARAAQDLRTSMRYFVFQEGKALLSGRMPQQLMKQLEESSAAPKMDVNLLSGALDAATRSAGTTLDNIDAQRFGGKARPRTLRGQSPLRQLTDPATNHTIATDNGKDWYDAKTGEVINGK